MNRYFGNVKGKEAFGCRIAQRSPCLDVGTCRLISERKTFWGPPFLCYYRLSGKEVNGDDVRGRLPASDWRAGPSIECPFTSFVSFMRSRNSRSPRMRQNRYDVTEASKNSPPWPTLYLSDVTEPHPPPETNDPERGGAARSTDGGTCQPQESRSLRNPNLDTRFFPILIPPSLSDRWPKRRPTRRIKNKKKNNTYSQGKRCLWSSLFSSPPILAFGPRDARQPYKGSPGVAFLIARERWEFYWLLCRERSEA
ncbi:hypothetical protein CEXT_605641 [Caerostris extrusa]|uniref:Uncharacterized protein n=1 Tax=Caerostris extrusa TaxID=172846 RepID=A0AAV4Y549_CAEEX|nr:hypothetical protein CEXT_605641 [Caerostris extrusa]